MIGSMDIGDDFNDDLFVDVDDKVNLGDSDSDSDWVNSPKDISWDDFKVMNSDDVFEQDPRILEKEESERIGYICEELGDMEITLKNKALRVWKALFLHSNVRGLEESDFIANPYDMSHISLNVEEETILLFLLNKKSKKITEAKALFDYYIFFKELGLKQEMIYVLDMLDQVKKFSEVYNLFREFCLEYENSMVKSLFSADPAFDITLEFDHAFSATLFNILKLKEKLIVHGSKIMTYNGIGAVSFHLHKYKLSHIVTRHPDFASIKEFDSISLKTKLTELYRTKKLSNLVLKTMIDGHTFHVHREIIIWKFNYVFRMIRFGGAESVTFKENNEIQLLDVESSVVGCLLEYLYTGKIKKNSSFTVLLRLIHQLEKFQELRLLTPLLDRGFGSLNRETLKNVLSQEGHLLRSEKLSKVMVPLLATQTRMREEEINKILRKSIKRYDLKFQMRSMEEAFLKQQKKSKELQKKHSKEMKKVKLEVENIKIECENKLEEMKKQYDGEIEKLKNMIQDLSSSKKEEQQ